MTEKRPTPNASTGKGRRKRAAPTIDLTATEVPATESAAAEVLAHDLPAHDLPAQDVPPVTSEADPPPPHRASADEPSVQAQAKSAPEPEAVSEQSDAPKENPSARPLLPVLAAGIAGAAAMSLVLFALWLTGLVPIRYAGSTALRARVTGLEMQLQDLQKRPPAGAERNPADAKTIETLTQRVAKMEESLTKTPAGDSALAERVTAADNAMKSLGVTLTALSRRNDELAANTAQARMRAEAAEKAVADLRAGLQDVSKTANAGASSADLAPLQQRIVTLEQTARTASAEIARTSASDTAARRALSAGLLRDSVLRGAPFTAELAQAKALGADDKTMNALSEFATTGLPTRAALAQELLAMIPGLRSLWHSQASDGSFIERLQANAGQLIRIRPVDAPPGDDGRAVLARLEAAAARADIPVAIVELGKLRRPELTDYERSPPYFWIMKAEKREAAAAAVQAYAADAARSLGSK